MTEAKEAALAAPPPAAAPARAPEPARSGLAGAKRNDTPDAIADCAACRPQSQRWRGLAPTTVLSEADHGQTTTTATH